MKKFENVLVAVDLTEYSDVVMGQGRKLAEILERPLVCVYVASRKMKNTKSKVEMSEWVKHNSDLIRKRYQLGPEVRVHIQFGEPDIQILEVAESYSNPLIVVGYRGGHSIAEFFLGSVAKQIALRSRFSVWIHRGDKVVHPSHIVVPSDLGIRSIPLVYAAQSLSVDLGSDFELFHVMHMPTPTPDAASYGIIYQTFKENDEHEVRQFKKTFPDLKVSRAEGDVTFEIRKKAKQFDLVVLSPSYRGADIPFFGTVTTHLISSGETPILVLHGLARVRRQEIDLW